MSSTGKADGAPHLLRDLLDLTGQCALITGTGGNIGAAIARQLARAGARVLLQQRRADGPALAEAARLRQEGFAAEATAGSIATVEAVEALLDEALARLQLPATIIVNAAGSYLPTPLAHTGLDAWRANLSDNLETAYACVGAAARRLSSSGGSVVLVASISAHRAAPDQAPYNAAKAGVLALMRSAAAELGRSGVRVNAVSPGLIHRPGIEQAWPEGVDRWRARAPLGTLGQPEDVADACLFLASPAARWITGHDLVVDGGMLASPAY